MASCRYTLGMSPATTKKIPPQARKVFQGKIFAIWQWDQELFDGSTVVFERVSRPDTVYLLPVLSDDRLLLIDDEQPHREAVLTIPRGRGETGEAPADGARRELLEETGYTVDKLLLWGSDEPWGKVAWTTYFYIGRGAHQVTESKPEAGERIALHPVTVEEFVDLAAAGALQNQWVQIMMLQAKLDPKNMEDFKKLLYAQ